MKQNPGFTLKEIAGVPYLLPFGQMIAEHKRGLKTNATGVYLWNLLSNKHTLEEVLSYSAEHYGINCESLLSFREDITQFLNSLLFLGILVKAEDTRNTSIDTLSELYDARAAAISCSETLLPVNRSDSIQKQTECMLSIGGLNLKLIAPEDAFPPDFADFVITEAPDMSLPIHQTIVLHPVLPQNNPHGHILLHDFELNILEHQEQYLLHFPVADKHLEIHLSKDGHTVHCYCLPPYTEVFHYDFFHAIRLVYLYLAQKSGMVALHSASILYKDRLWLFSGHSGMGKSTHTNLWKEHFGTPVINGDLNLLAIENGQPVVHGIPWCGTSGIYDTKTYPLGGIILLNQAPENRLEELSSDQKQLLVSQRLISPSWTKELFEKNLDIIKGITKDILICRLHCTKEKEAAEVMKEYIDTLPL